MNKTIEEGWIIRIPSGATYNDNTEYDYDKGPYEQPTHRTRGDKMYAVQFTYPNGARLSRNEPEICVDKGGQRSFFFYANEVDVLVRENHALSQIHAQRYGRRYGRCPSSAVCACGERFSGTGDEIRADHHIHLGEIAEASLAQVIY